MDTEIDVERHFVRALDGRLVRLLPMLWRAFALLYACQRKVARASALRPNGCDSLPRESVRQLRKRLEGTPWCVITHPSIGRELARGGENG
jgi:hypothetical protein